MDSKENADMEITSSSIPIDLTSTHISDFNSIYPKSDFVSMDSFFSGPMTVKDPKGTTFKFIRIAPLESLLISNGELTWQLLKSTKF